MFQPGGTLTALALPTAPFENKNYDETYDNLPQQIQKLSDNVKGGRMVKRTNYCFKANSYSMIHDDAELHSAAISGVNSSTSH